MVHPKKPPTRPRNLVVAAGQLCCIMLFRTPIWLRLWLICLMGTNMIGFYFLDTIEGQAVVGVMPLMFLVMTGVYQKCGYVKLLGISHAFWLILVPWIIRYRLPLVNNDDDIMFQRWLTALVTMNSISLSLDIKDVVEYLALGKKQESLEY